jgi:hypothetical protein
VRWGVRTNKTTPGLANAEPAFPHRGQKRIQSSFPHFCSYPRRYGAGLKFPVGRCASAAVAHYCSRISAIGIFFALGRKTGDAFMQTAVADGKFIIPATIKEASMKTWKLLVCAISLIFLILAGTACQQSGETKKAELRGSIQKETDGSGFFLRSGGRRYHIESAEDLTAMVGKMVNMQGSISEIDGKYSIAMESMVEK